MLAKPLMYVFGELINIETKIFVTPKKDRAFHRSVQQILNFNLSKDHWSLQWCLIWITGNKLWINFGKHWKIKRHFSKVNFYLWKCFFWMLNQTGTKSVPFCQTSDYTNFPFYFILFSFLFLFLFLFLCSTWEIKFRVNKCLFC